MAYEETAGCSGFSADGCWAVFSVRLLRGFFAHCCHVVWRVCKPELLLLLPLRTRHSWSAASCAQR